jgi:hypothetical protein
MSSGTNNFSNFQNAFTNIQQVNADYSPYIIKPPDRNKTHGSISKHIVIDSRDRNYTLYPNSNKYRIDLPQELRDVTSIELTLAQIPNTYYNISDSNNVFYISENPNNIVSVNIPEGQYSNNSLIDSLNGKYGDLFYQLISKYNFSRNPINLKLRIQSNRLSDQEFIYNLNYLTNDNCSPCQLNSIDKTIGFINKQYQSEMVDLSYIYVGTGGITAYGGESDQDYTLYKLVATQNYGGIEVDFNKTFYVNDYFILNDAINNIKYSCQVYEIKNDFTIVFETLDKKNPTGLTGNIFNNISVLYSPNIFQVENKPYVVLKLKEAKSLESVGKSDGAFALIPLLNLESTIINQSTVPVHSLIKYFSVPIGKLYWMDIEFSNYDGTLFNFRGQENMMTFTITCLNQPGKYNNYVDSN